MNRPSLRRRHTTRQHTAQPTHNHQQEPTPHPHNPSLEKNKTPGETKKPPRPSKTPFYKTNKLTTTITLLTSHQFLQTKHLEYLLTTLFRLLEQQIRQSLFLLYFEYTMLIFLPLIP